MLLSYAKTRGFIISLTEIVKKKLIKFNKINLINFVYLFKFKFLNFKFNFV